MVRGLHHRESTHMTLQERHIGDAVVLDLEGRLTLEDGSERLKDKINSLLHQQVRQLFINLDHTSYIDSSGLGQLVASSTAVARQGGSLKLFNLGRQPRDLLVMTKLLVVFDTYPTEQAALRSVAQRVA